MKTLRTTTFCIALAGAALLAGCGSTGLGDIYGGGSGGDRGTGGTYDDRPGDRYVTGDVQGTVERVDTLNRRIVIDSDDDSRYNLRNGSGSGQVALYYDDRTTVEYQGRTYSPADLERGDRIRADIADGNSSNGDRLLAEQIEVLRDATAGDDQGSYGNDDNDRYGDYDRDSDSLRGTVRSVDTRGHLLEIEPVTGSRFTTGRSSDVITVRFDANTTVEFEGRRYQPDNLERGDVVEIDLSGPRDRPFAEQIVVVESR